MRVLFVSAILVLADQISKSIVVRTMALYESIPIVQNFFHFTYITNDGMAFGIDFPFGYLIFSGVSVLLTVFLFFWMLKSSNNIEKWGILLILTGAISNISDRAMNNYVMDFISFH